MVGGSDVIAVVVLVVAWRQFHEENEFRRVSHDCATL